MTPAPDPPLREPTVAVVILTWNGQEDTLRCLASLAESTWPRLRVYVADNASSDGTEAEVREQFPEVEFIQNGSNLGFAGGNNTGIAAAIDRGANLVLLLNNDTVVPPDAVGDLVRTLAESPRAGACSPVLPYLADPQRLWFAGSHYDPARGHSGRNSAYETGAAPLPDEPVEVDRLVGAAMLVRADVIRAVGSLDPDLFYLHEDVDWSLRIRAAGHTLLLDPRVAIPHAVAASQGGHSQSPLTAYYGTRNDLELGRRYGPAGRMRRAWRQTVSFGIHVAAARNAPAGSRLACARASLAGLADYRRRRLGPRGGSGLSGA